MPEVCRSGGGGRYRGADDRIFFAILILVLTCWPVWGRIRALRSGGLLQDLAFMKMS